MVAMAAHYSLLAENPIRTAARSGPQAILNYLTTESLPDWSLQKR